MPIEKTKDVTINGRDFQVGLVPADIGNWIVLQMAGGKAADFDIQQKIQRYIFGLCSVYVTPEGGNRSPMKIYEAGRWLVPDLEYDLDTINTLYLEALDFNFTPFFEKQKAKKATEASQATPL